jgi:hypothetical protein
MNRRMSAWVAAVVVAVGTAGAATLTLDNPALSGQVDATVGWGFTIESTPVMDGGNLITPWLLITHADFVPDVGLDPVGVFTAFITQLPNSNNVVGPDDGNGEVNPWSQSFDNMLMTGIGSYVINDFQSPGDEVTGEIVLTFDLYRLSPDDLLFDSTVDTIAVDQTLSAVASVTVDAPAPEPGTIWLLAAGGAVVAWKRWGSGAGVMGGGAS